MKVLLFWFAELAEYISGSQLVQTHNSAKNRLSKFGLIMNLSHILLEIFLHFTYSHFKLIQR